MWSILKNAISSVIKTNNNQEITGSVLQQVLLSIVSNVGANSTFAGIATPTTSPGTPDGPVFYIASDNGTYANFGGITVSNEVAILLWKNNAWTKAQTNIASSANIAELSTEISNTTTELVKRIEGTSESSLAYTDPNLFLGYFNTQTHGTADAAWAAALDKLNSLSLLENPETKKYIGLLTFNYEGMLFKVLNFVNSYSEHKYVQYIFGPVSLKSDGTLRVSHAKPSIYVRYTTEDMTGNWNPWTSVVDNVQCRVLDLGSFNSEADALVAAKLTNVSADSSVSIIRFDWDNGMRNGVIIQQVGSQVDDNLIDTHQWYSYGGRCYWRLIQWYYADDEYGHHSKDFYTATPFKFAFGNSLHFDASNRKLQLLGIKNELVSEVVIPVDNPERVTSVELGANGELVVTSVDSQGQEDVERFSIPVATLESNGLMSAADKQAVDGIPTLQGDWISGSEQTYIYSKPWSSSGDNTKTVLAVGTHLAQHNGKLKMRNVFWGGGSTGVSYGVEVPVASQYSDGAMSAADKIFLDSLRERFSS